MINHLLWKSAIVFKTESISNKSKLNEAVEVNFTQSNKTSIPLSPNNKNQGRQRLLLTFEKGKVIETIIEYIPSDDFMGDIKAINSSNFFANQFDGEITFQSPKNDFKTIWYLSKGKIIRKGRRFKTKPVITAKSANYDLVVIERCNTTFVCLGDGTVENVCFGNTKCYYDYFFINTGGSGGGGGGSVDNGGYSDPFDCNVNNSWPWCQGGSGSGDGNNTVCKCPTKTKDEIAKTIEEQIDDSQLDPCTRAIMEKLKNLKNSDIASIFEKFGVPVNGTYNIEIVLGKPENDAKASTTSVYQNNYKITILDTYIYGTDNNGIPPTDLSIAAVIIHELVHANFLALFDDYHNNGDICAYDNFTCLYEKYVSKNYQGTIDAQHAQMFDDYIDKMASMLAEFKPGQSYEFYQDLAMSTMVGLKYFEDRYPVGSAERSRIIQSRLAEDNNEARGDILPKGTPCSK